MANPTPKKQTWEDSCWAACMEMWTGCMPKWEQHTEAWFGDNYSDRGVMGLTPDGRKFWQLLNKYGLSMKIVDGSVLDEKEVRGYLNRGGCFMYIESYGGASSHARLAYDYDAPTRGLLICEPATGRKTTHYLMSLKDMMLVYKL